MHHRPNVKHRATKPPENKIRGSNSGGGPHSGGLFFLEEMTLDSVKGWSRGSSGGRDGGSIGRVFRAKGLSVSKGTTVTNRMV